MKKIYLAIRLVLFVLILSLGTMAALVAGETQGLALADMSGAPVQVMATAAQDNTLYATLAGGAQSPGLYRSADNGITWQRVGSGPAAEVKALAVERDADRLYAGTAGGRMGEAVPLWHSFDGGRTWQPAPLGLPADPEGIVPDVTALAADPSRPGVVYVGTDGHGVYRYDAQAGAYGFELLGGLALRQAHVRSLAVAPGGVLYALTNDGLFASDGQTWQPLSLPEMATSLAVAPDDPRRLYAGGVSTGMHRSTDGGRTWVQVNTGVGMIPGVALRVTALAVDEEDPRQVAVATAYGVGNKIAPGAVYMSRDGGYRWSKLAQADGVVSQLSLHRGAVYAATDRGLARYGELAGALPQLRSLRSLADPSGIQALILALTIVLAALVLVGRTEWLLKRVYQARS